MYSTAHALKRFVRYVGIALSILCGSCAAATTHGAPQVTNVEKSEFTARKLAIRGQVVLAKRVVDGAGTHLLLLSRHAGPSPENPASHRVEHIDLLAAYYREDQQGHWQPEWTIRDGTECPGLDTSADFFATDVRITDLNGDGRAEVTVPYRLFCGGGVDPFTVKVILREGDTKLAVRGESRVIVAGHEAFGGPHQFDDALRSPALTAYKRHLDQVWRKVSVDNR